MLLNNIRFSHNPTLLYAAISKSSPSIPSPALNEVKKALRDPQSCCLPQGSAGGLRAQAERGDLASPGTGSPQVGSLHSWVFPASLASGSPARIAIVT